MGFVASYPGSWWAESLGARLWDLLFNVSTWVSSDEGIIYKGEESSVH